MNMSFGKLVVSESEGSRQEFTLAKHQVAIGRSTANDIVLNDTNVSRNHLSLECNDAGCTVADLGSANGTRLNGARVDRATLQPGDVIEAGKYKLRFEEDHADPEAETRVQTIAAAFQAQEEGPLEKRLEETSEARLAVYTPGGTWELPLTEDVFTIGRLADNTIVIESTEVSRHHARIERRGNGFLLKDLGSNNGTCMGGHRVSEHVLRPGDTIRIGPARLTFKSSVDAEDLTVVAAPSGSTRARRPVVIVPGFGGSKLWLGSEQIWPNMRQLFRDVDVLHLGAATAFEARGLVDRAVIVPNVIKLEQYSHLTDYLEEHLGYERGRDLLEFAYDFRQDLRVAARQLAAAIDAWKASPPLTLLCHSMGCLVGRYYVERLGGSKNVDRLILMGGPNNGTPRSLSSLLLGPRLLPFGLWNEKLRQLLATFPSAYQILPGYACATDPHGRSIDVLDDDTWLAPDKRPLLEDARRFRAELGTGTSVPTVCIFGYGINTITRVQVERDSAGSPLRAEEIIEPAGDSTVPEVSTVMEGAEIHPVKQYHGVLYTDSDVKMRLKLELTR